MVKSDFEDYRKESSGDLNVSFPSVGNPHIEIIHYLIMYLREARMPQTE